MDYTVAQVPAEATWELRQVVLRPHQRVEDMALPDDDVPPAASFAAVNHDGEVVATVRVAPAPSPPVLEGQGAEGSWQLRGMATRPDLRGLGIGAAVLDRAVDHVGGAGGGLLWCNARVPARSLYRRAGFVEIGAQWVDPDIGPHVVMWRLVAPLPDGTDP